MNPFLIGLQPLRRFADFRGRSTRTELVMFYILTTVAGAVANIASGFAGLPNFLPGDLMGLALLCPWLALGVRRLHDSGRSGWWLFLAVPGCAINLRRQFLLWYYPVDLEHLYLPAYVELPTGLLAVAVLILLLMDDQQGPNANGLNPRYPDDFEVCGPPGEPS
jgi:uncharacterized membrane protein YhaH (DUF805 family)